MSTFEALLSGASWSGDGVVGRPAFITFSFETGPADYAAGRYPEAFLGSFQAFTEAEQTIARQALKLWADASGVTFLEVPAGQGDIRFGVYDFDLAPANLSKFAGFASYPAVFMNSVRAVDLPWGGDIYIDRGYASFGTIFGGAGADRFHSFGEAGIDRIEDFNLAEGDRLNLLAGTTYTLSQSGADAIISMGGGGMVVLVGVQASSLAGDWLTVG